MIDKILKVVQTIMMAYVCSALLLAILAFVAYKAGMSENVVIYGVLAVYTISTFVAGLIIGIKQKHRRAVWGLATGALYYGVILVISAVMNRGIAAGTADMAVATVLCILGGFAGGYVSHLP